MLNGNGHRRLPVVGRPSREHFIHHNAQRVQVGSGIHLRALRLLRGNIVDGAQRLPGQGILRGIEPGNAKIGHLDAAVLENHNIVGLDVPVDNPPRMGVLQRLGDLGGKMQRLPPVEGAPLLHILFESQAVNELHHDIVRIPGMVHVVHRYNIGMGQHGHRLALRMEPAAEVLVPAELLLEDFHRHKAVEPVTSGPIDHGHAAPADLLEYLITAIQQPSDIFIHRHRSLAMMLS